MSKMTSRFAAAMRRAAGATRAFNVFGATRIIQKALAGSLGTKRAGKRPTAEKRPIAEKAKGARAASDRQRADTLARLPATASAKVPAEVPAKVPAKTVAKTAAKTAAEPKAQAGTGVVRPFRRPLGEVLETLRGLSAFTRSLPGQSGPLSPRQIPLPDLPEGASFASRSFTSAAGTRAFRLYVPASAPERPDGLIIMLHGCTQCPEDFAAGTNMNAFAEEHRLLIAYPAQTRGHNASSCWNWFEPGHQVRDAGEPAILAGLTRKLVKEFGIDRDRVFVAGLSAGAAMAVILGKTYPDLYTAVGVHSGLAYQSAGNVMSALSVMRGQSGSGLFGAPASTGPGSDAGAKPVRTIIFHGSADRTVHPSNAQRIAEAAMPAIKRARKKSEAGSNNGRRFTQTIVANENGSPQIESWLIDGAGHAWSGGKASGSYTDAKGPDASREMVRFFLQAK